MANLNLHPHDGEREGACLDLAGDRKEERVRTQPAAAILCDSAGREDPATSSLAASPPYPRADLMDGRSGRGCGTTATELGMGHGDGGAVANGNPWVRDACGEEAPEEKGFGGEKGRRRVAAGGSLGPVLVGCRLQPRKSGSGETGRAGARESRGPRRRTADAGRRRKVRQPTKTVAKEGSVFFR